MQATDVTQMSKETLLTEPAITHALLPLARLQILQSSQTVSENELNRSSIEPQLTCNADGLWTLTIHKQGAYREFEVPYIHTEILLADPELGLLALLINYHGTATTKYGRRGYLISDKGQFWQYYQQQTDGAWQRVKWQSFNDELRTLILDIAKEQAPTWANKPGKLRSERKPPSKPVEMASYKVVRCVNDRYFSLYDPGIEYIPGVRMKQIAKPRHAGGFYSHATIQEGQDYLELCLRAMPFDREFETPAIALVECEIGGRILNYGRKLASTYICLTRVLEIREIG